MNRLGQLLRGLALVLVGIGIGVAGVNYASQRTTYPPLVDPASELARGVPQTGVRPDPPPRRILGAERIGEEITRPQLAVSQSGRLAGRPFIELPALLASPLVQAQLQLDDEQKQQVAGLNAADREFDPTLLMLTDRPRSQIAAVDHANRAMRRNVLLTDAQRATAKRLLLQLNQEYSFADAVIAAELGLSPAQKDAMQSALNDALPAATPEELEAAVLLRVEENHRRFAPRLGGLATAATLASPSATDEASGKLEARNRKLAESFPQACRKLRDVLTSEQQRQWDAMLGVRLEGWELEEIRASIAAGRGDAVD